MTTGITATISTTAAWAQPQLLYNVVLVLLLYIHKYYYSWW
jgi:hypothetical protein